MTIARQVTRTADALSRDEQGFSLVGIAVGVATLLGVAAFTVDMGYMYVLRNQLQTTADAAVGAATAFLPDADAARTEALNYVQANMPSSAHGAVLANSDFEVGNWNGASKVFTVNGLPANAVRATLRRDSANSNPVGTFFASVMGFESLSVGAQSIALQKIFTAPCLLALDPTSSDAFIVRSNAYVDIQGCGVTINSNSASALTMFSNASFHTAGTCIVGGYDGAGADYSPAPATSCDPMPDPLAGKPLPPTTPAAAPPPNGSGCNFVNKTVPVNTTATLTPGVYCGGINMRSNTVVTMQPGIYVIKDGPFHTDSNTVVSGAGILIYLTGSGAIIDLNSNSIVDLKAHANSATPVIGTYAGILIFQNPAFGGTHRINSNSNKLFEGVIYLPQGDILVDSNSVIASTAPCTMLIARRFRFDSNAGVEGVFDLNPNTTTCSVPIPDGLQTTTTSALVR